MKFNEQKEIPTWLIALVVFSISVALLLLGLYFFQFTDREFFNFFPYNRIPEKYLSFLSKTQSTWGVFGDYIGGVLNPLFSLMAFLGLLYTIRLQSKELKNSEKAMMRQQFETTFFHMLSLFTNVINNSESNSEYHGKNLKGRSFIAYMRTELGSHLRNTPTDSINIEYEKFQMLYNYSLNAYFINFYNILKFIEKGNLSEENKKFYSNILRSQLSRDELILLFYHSIDNENLLPLLKKYRLLKYLDTYYLANVEDGKIFSQLFEMQDNFYEKN